MKFSKLCVSYSNEKYDFDMADLSAEEWKGVAEDILAVTASPIVPMVNTTRAKIVVRDNVAEFKFSFNRGSNLIVGTITLDEFGCKRDNYCGKVSEIFQLAMMHHFGESYSKALDEKKNGLTL